VRFSSDPERLRSLTSFPYFGLAGENAGWYHFCFCHQFDLPLL
jgi:hypothetical protein